MDSVEKLTIVELADLVKAGVYYFIYGYWINVHLLVKNELKILETKDMAFCNFTVLFLKLTFNQMFNHDFPIDHLFSKEEQEGGYLDDEIAKLSEQQKDLNIQIRGLKGLKDGSLENEEYPFEKSEQEIPKEKNEIFSGFWGWYFPYANKMFKIEEACRIFCGGIFTATRHTDVIDHNFCYMNAVDENPYVKRFRGGLSVNFVLDMIARSPRVFPSLGFIGTVIGFIDAFPHYNKYSRALEASVKQTEYSLFVEGILFAMISTLLGLLLKIVIEYVLGAFSVARLEREMRKKFINSQKFMLMQFNKHKDPKNFQGDLAHPITNELLAGVET